MGKAKLVRIKKQRGGITLKREGPLTFKFSGDDLLNLKPLKNNGPKIILKEIRQEIDDIPVCFEEIINNESQKKCEIAVFTEGLNESDVFGMFRGYFNSNYHELIKFADNNPIVSAGVDFSLNKAQPTIYGDPELCNVVRDFIQINQLDQLKKMIIVLEFRNE